MTTYSIAVTHAADMRSTVKLVRSVSSESVATIAEKIGTENPVIELDTWAFPPEMTYDDGVPYQHRKILALISELEKAGATLLIGHHADSIVEIVSMDIMKNLFESELVYLAQKHD